MFGSGSDSIDLVDTEFITMERPSVPGPAPLSGLEGILFFIIIFVRKWG